MKAGIKHELITRLYASMPYRLQNVAFSFHGYNLKRKRYGKDFWEIYNWLKETQFWSKERIADYQVQEMKRIVSLAYERVPYYSKMMKKLHLRPSDFERLEDLKQLPITTKAQIKKNPNEFRNSDISRKIHLAYTSGTTGTPLEIALTSRALQFQWAVWWRHKSRFELKPGDKHLVFGARLPVLGMKSKPPFWRIDKANNRYYMSIYHISQENICDIVQMLNEVNFDFYTGYPSALYSLVKHMKKTNLKVKNAPRIVVCGADALTPLIEEEISEVLGVRVTDQYGSAEACGNFSRCEYGKYHLDFEFGIAELLPVRSSANPNIRKIVFTGFANDAMPLIRYDIGDYGVYSEERCKCGRESIFLDSIDGRTEELIRTPDGRLVSGLNQVFEWSNGIDGAQIIQEKIEEVRVLIVTNSNFTPFDREKINNELSRRLGSNVSIKFEFTSQLFSSKSGKSRLVISHIDPNSYQEEDLRKRQ